MKVTASYTRTALFDIYPLLIYAKLIPAASFKLDSFACYPNENKSYKNTGRLNLADSDQNINDPFTLTFVHCPKLTHLS